MSDAKETPKEGSLAKELFAGATGGIAQVLIGVLRKEIMRKMISKINH
jgi:hypothetical protein